MPGRPIPSVSAPLRCADYRTEATRQEATGTQAAERTERAPFWLTYDSTLPDGGHIDPERLYKAIRYLKGHPERTRPTCTALFGCGFWRSMRP
jgi:hypothetical protein